MADNLKDLFGSDSDDSDAEQATASSAVAPQQKQFDVDELFGSSDSEDEAPAKAPASRLKKGADKAGKKEKAGKAGPKRGKNAPLKSAAKGASGDTRAKKRPRSEASGSEAAGGGGADGQDAYDSGDEVVATAADNAFIDSDDELGDIKAEYDAEQQRFGDERDDGFESDGDEGPRPSKAEVISKKSANMIDKAILASRKQRSSEMSDMDKQAVASALVEKMDEAWRSDCGALTSRPPRPALAKLAALDAVGKVMAQRSLHDTLLDMNALEAVRNWLAPFPAEDPTSGREIPLGKRTLPNLTLRTQLYALLKNMPIMPEHLKNSERGGDEHRPGLGKVALMLLKHPQETPDNKRALQALLEDWSRRIFKRTRDYKQLGRHLKAGSSSSSGGGAAAGQFPQALRRQSSGAAADDFLGAGGGQGAAEVESARVALPRRVGFDFKVRPAAPVVEAAKKGKQQEKKQALAVKMKEQRKQVVNGSQRGEAPLHRVDL